MKLAVVTDRPTISKPSARYVARMMDAIGMSGQFEYIPAVPVDSPGMKAPLIAELRDSRDGLLERIEDYDPDSILTLGAAALSCLEGGSRQLRREAGRTRLVEGRPVTPTTDAWRVARYPDLHRDFSWSLQKAATGRGPLPPMDIETYVCRTTDDLERSLALLEGASVVSCDVETTGLRGWADEITAYGLGAMYEDGSGVAVVTPIDLLRDPKALDLLWDHTWSRVHRTVGHNLKFDQQFVQRLFGAPTPPEARISDTLLLAHLLDERPNNPKSRVRGSGLKDLVAMRYDYEYGFDFHKPYDELTQEEIDELHLYLGDDVGYTARLWHDLESEAVAEGGRIMEAHDELLAPVSRAVAAAELVGSPIDRAWVEETIELLTGSIAGRKAHLEVEITKLTVTLVVDNILSPGQIADVMYDEWQMTPDVRKHGKGVANDRSTDADHIRAAVAKYMLPKWDGTKQRAGAEWLAELVLLRKDVRLKSVYQKQLLDFADDDDRIHPSFLLHGAATGRISAREPAIQTIPAVDDKRESAYNIREYQLRDRSWVTRPMRRAFAPAPGRMWVEADYSQLELRVAAGISGDQAFAEVFRSGRDVHREIAAAIFSKDPAAITKAERYLAKAVSFGILYGRSAKALAAGEEMDYAVAEDPSFRRWDEDTAEAFTKKFLQSYPDLTAWITLMQESAPAQGYVESPSGRRRRFPLVTDQELGAIQRQAVNTPIQGEASDICLRAFVALTDAVAETLPGRATVLFPVHDSICLEVDEDAIDTLEGLCKDIMQIDFMGCPLTIDFEVGPSWADVSKPDPQTHGNSQPYPATVVPTVGLR